METMQGRNKVATMKMERMEGPAGGWQAEAAVAAGSRGARGRKHEGPWQGAGSMAGTEKEGVPGCAGLEAREGEG